MYFQDYSKPIENQQKLLTELHWRKHTLAWIDQDGKVDISYRAVIDKTLDDEMHTIQPASRTY